MVELKYRFYKNKERADIFASKVNGEVFDNTSWEYEVGKELVEYGEDYREQFPYVVIWDNTKLTDKQKAKLEKESQVIDIFNNTYLGLNSKRRATDR